MSMLQSMLVVSITNESTLTLAGVEHRFQLLRIQHSTIVFTSLPERT